MSPSRRDSLGFTLVEVLVAITIVALLGLIIVPVVLGRLDVARAESIVAEMQTLQTGIQMFQRDVGRYPKRLDYLVVLPGSGVVDACDAPISAQNQAKFRGPYINRSIADSAGGTVGTRYTLATDDSVDWTPTRTTITAVSGGTQQVLQILVRGPEQGIVEEIDTDVDGVVDGTQGTIRYSAIQPNENILVWTFPITNGAC